MPEVVRGKLLRIFIDEGERWKGEPLSEAIVQALRTAGFAGATVLKGIEGFGRRATIHSARPVDFSANLPVLIEVFEQEDKVLTFVPQLRAMIGDGLITLENVQVAQWT